MHAASFLLKAPLNSLFMALPHLITVSRFYKSITALELHQFQFFFVFSGRFRVDEMHH